MGCFDRCVSQRTREEWRPIDGATAYSWQFGTYFMLAGTLSVTIAINIRSANNPDNDYSENFGWFLMMPGVVATFVWSLFCMLLCSFWYLPVKLALFSYPILSLGLIAEGIVTILMYSWHRIAYLPGIFMIVDGIYCFGVILTAFYAWRGKKRLNQGVNSKEAMDAA